MAVTHSTEASFQTDVLGQKGPILVDFYADWCGPCKITSPIIEELSTEMPQVKFVKVDVDQNQNLAAKYSIFSIPSFLIFKDGKLVSQFVGAQSKESFEEEIGKAVNS